MAKVDDEHLLATRGPEGLQRHQDADPAPDVSHLVALGSMTLHAGLFGHQGLDQAQVILVRHMFHRTEFRGSLPQCLESLGFPKIRGIFRTQGFETDDAPLHLVLLQGQLI